MSIKVKILNEEATLPRYQTDYAAGFDFHSVEGVNIYPGETLLLPTGLAFEIEPDTCLQLVSRSSLAMNGIIVANSPGIVDADYRGEVKIMLKNISDRMFSISKHDRIAQGVVVRVVRSSIEAVSFLSDTKRGNGGFGSTGK